MPPPKMVWDRQVKSYPQQIKLFWSIVDKFTGQPALVDFAAQIIRDNNVNEKDVTELARFVQQYVQREIKFFRERPERWQSPMRTLQWGIGDCDDQALLVATTLRSFRVPVRFKFVRFLAPSKSGRAVRKSHVYAQAKLPIDGKPQWVSLETVKPVEMGFDAADMMKAQGIRILGIDYVGDK